MEFRILGPLEADQDGSPVPLGGHRQRALLALLLLRPNEVVSTERLVDALWNGRPPATARTSLQNAVAALRRVLEPDVLVTRAPGYLLRVDPDQVDAARFRRLLAEARSADAVERSRVLGDALALWRGAPLADLEYDEFLQDDVRHLEELRLAALEDRIDADLELGRHGETVPELERLVRAHPLRERLRGQLMLALYRSGRQAHALAAYQDGRRTLVEELGIDPGPALQRLHAAILRQERAVEGVAAGTRGSEEHLEEVCRALLAGRLVVVLGAETTGLAGRLAERFDVPAEASRELTRLAQHVAAVEGTGPLHDELHAIFAATVPGAVHQLVAQLPRLLREREAPPPLVLTTALDLSVEQSLLAAGEELDLVTYLASGRHRGRFCHLPPAGTAHVIDVPNTYVAELSQGRPVVLRLAGGLGRGAEREWESFVVTEDDFIDYLAEATLAPTVPAGLAARLRRSHLLFLGFGLDDWSLRTVVARVWGADPLRYRSWAVAPRATPVERHAWRARGVELVERPLEEYVELLARHAGIAAEASA